MQKNTEKLRRETFTSLPEVVMILAKRFMAIHTHQGFRNEKITSDINPSNNILLNNIKYTIKSVIIHNGFEKVSNAGHYTVALKETNGDWIMCDDLSIHKTKPPMNGYIFLYERAGIVTPSLSSVDFEASQQNEQMLTEDTYSDKHSTAKGKNIQSLEAFKEPITYNTEHSQELPHHCSHCAKTFSNHIDLKRHLALHTVKKTISM